MTPTQRRYLEDAVRCQGGELRWSVRSGGAEGAIHRMVKMLVAAELVAFDPRRMAWVVTRAGGGQGGAAGSCRQLRFHRRGSSTSRRVGLLPSGVLS
jgi:hypothetical protein